MIRAWSLGYKKAREKAKNIYSKIGRVQCPVFNDEFVSFTSNGFRHLVRKGRIARTKNEQKKRFVLLKHAERMVKNPTYRLKIEFEEKELIERVNRFGTKVLVKKKAKAWTLIENIDDCTVKLVIGQVDGRGKEFLSIMGDNVQIRPVRNKRIKKQKTA